MWGNYNVDDIYDAFALQKQVHSKILGFVQQQRRLPVVAQLMDQYS